MSRLHLHLLSDSTGETLEMIGKAALAQFDDTDIVRHFWPMVRSKQHLDRIIGDIANNPGLVLFTLVDEQTRARLEEHCRALGLPSVAVLDAVTDDPDVRRTLLDYFIPAAEHLRNDTGLPISSPRR